MSRQSITLYHNPRCSKSRQALAENPILIERPIAVKGEKALVGRPPEQVLELL